MARNKTSSFDTMDTPYEVQPPTDSAEGPVVYGGVTDIAAKGSMRDPMGVLPVDAQNPKNIGPAASEGEG
jgi:hypothetical protein